VLYKLGKLYSVARNRKIVPVLNNDYNHDVSVYVRVDGVKQAAFLGLASGLCVWRNEEEHGKKQLNCAREERCRTITKALL
jgi:hypothetical protein